MENWHRSQASHFDFRGSGMGSAVPENHQNNRVLFVFKLLYFSVSPIQIQRLALYLLIKLKLPKLFFKISIYLLLPLK